MLLYKVTTFISSASDLLLGIILIAYSSVSRTDFLIKVVYRPSDSDFEGLETAL